MASAFVNDFAKPRAGRGWTILGLNLALAGPLLLASPPAQIAYAQAGPAAAALGQAMLWVLVALVLLVLRFGERLPFAAIGLVLPRLRSVLWGLGIGGAVYALLGAIVLTLAHLGLFDNAKASAAVLEWPLGYRIFAAASAGPIEEILFRGYAIERLTALTGRRGLAASLALAGFVVAHVPFWGLSGIATPLIGGGFFTLLYLWRRDLVLCMVAHSAIDLIGLVLIPAMARAG